MACGAGRRAAAGGSDRRQLSDAELPHNVHGASPHEKRERTQEAAKRDEEKCVECCMLIAHCIQHHVGTRRQGESGDHPVPHHIIMTNTTNNSTNNSTNTTINDNNNNDNVNSTNDTDNSNSVLCALPR